jgi:tetratricopeptide (TPR) repeat protein
VTSERAIEIKPEDPRNYFNQALVHGAKKDHRRAIADYTEAIRIMPSLAIAYNNRGYELEAMGEVKQAITDYRQALRLAPSLAAVIRPNLQRLGAEP